MRRKRRLVTAFHRLERETSSPIKPDETDTESQRPNATTTTPPRPPNIRRPTPSHQCHPERPAAGRQGGESWHMSPGSQVTLARLRFLPPFTAWPCREPPRGLPCTR